MYERNHASMEYFSLFVRQMGKVKEYLKQNPADLEKRMYFAHLFTEVGAGPLAVEQAEKVFTGYHLAGDVNAEKDSLLVKASDHHRWNYTPVACFACGLGSLA